MCPLSLWERTKQCPLAPLGERGRRIGIPHPPLTPKNPMIFLAFLIFAALFVMGATAQGWSYIGLFLDVPSLLFTLLGIAGFFLVFGRKEFGRGVKTFFAFSYPQDDHSPESGRFFLRLTTFTLSWGLWGVVFGMLGSLVELNPDTVGQTLAFSLLSFLYASGLALLVFLPIGIRLSPPTLPLPISWRFSVWNLFVGLVAFYLVRCLAVIVALLIPSPEKPNVLSIPINNPEVVFQRAAFILNPVDSTG